MSTSMKPSLVSQPKHFRRKKKPRHRSTIKTRMQRHSEQVVSIKHSKKEVNRYRTLKHFTASQQILRKPRKRGSAHAEHPYCVNNASGFQYKPSCPQSLTFPIEFSTKENISLEEINSVSKQLKQSNIHSVYLNSV